MPKMKDSGIPWIGMIPEGWEGRRLKSVATLSPPVEISHVAPDDEVSFLPMDCVKQGTYIPNAAPVAKLNASYCLFSQGDIVMAKVTPCFENGNIARADGLIRGVGFGSSELFVLRRKEGMCRDFLFWMLQAEPFRSKAIESMSGAGGLKRVSVDAVKNYWFFCPGLPEQQRIAEYLDSKCAKIDDTIDKQRVVIEKLKAYKQSVITEAVTKGLDPHAPMKDSGIEWIGMIPEGWKVCCIKHIKSQQKNSFVDGPFGSNLKSEHFIQNGDVYVIESNFATQGNIDEDKLKTISNKHFETIKRSEAKCDDVIIAKIGEYYGMAHILPRLSKPCVVSGNSLKLTVDKNRNSEKYVCYCFVSLKKNGIFCLRMNSTGQPALSLGVLNQEKIPCPPFPEQRQIADYLDKKCTDIDTAIAKKEALIERLGAFKKSLIYECVTGKREVV